MVRTVAAATPAFLSYGHGDCASWVDTDKSRKAGIIPEPMDVKYPSCAQKLGVADESGLVNFLQEHRECGG